MRLLSFSHRESALDSHSGLSALVRAVPNPSTPV